MLQYKLITGFLCIANLVLALTGALQQNPVCIVNFIVGAFLLYRLFNPPFEE